MEKLKSVISHAHRKSVGATKDRNDSPTTTGFNRPASGGLTGGGSRLASADQTTKDTTTSGTESENYHPIYDQFTGSKSTMSGEPIKTTDHAPHFSNMTDVKQTPGTSGTSSDPTATIKSGVMGFPQGAHDAHAAFGNRSPVEQRQGGNQIVGGDSTPRTTGKQKDASRLGRDAAIGADAVRVGGLVADELTSKPEDTSYNTPRPKEQQPVERSRDEPTTAITATTGTDRSFPLAGGVTTRRPSEKTTTGEREPGTKGKEAGVHDVQGREALAGAVAAAAASSALPRSEREKVVEPESKGSSARDNYHPEALAAATAAASTARSVPPAGQEHGHDHTCRGDPPKLHIPGSFPTPTPAEEPSAPSYLESKGTTTAATGVQPELRHTSTLDEPQRRSTDESEKPTTKHHYGQDAAVAGRLGAAGVGAYAAGKHHKKETTDIDGETLPTETSPYSSTKLDPRVDSKPAGFGEQRYDPTVSEKHHGRDAALTDGALGAAGAAGHEATKPHEAQPTANQAKSTPQGKDEKSQHHGARDAALIGAGAATTAGLYANQRVTQPDSGPASSTIGPYQSNTANVLDPRVQLDPALQKHHCAAPTVEDPAHSTVGPHKSDIANIADPRVLPGPEKQKAHTTTGPHKSDTLNRIDPREPHKAAQEEQHHYERDAAVAGGVRAAGYGSYEAAKTYDEHCSTQPGASMDEQRYDPSAPGAHGPTMGTKQPAELPSQKPQHHYTCDAAVAGGLGAAGAGAYAATGGHEHPQQAPATQQQYPPTQTAQLPPAYQAYHQPAAATHQRYDSVQDPNNQHQNRDAALGIAAVAGAGGAYAYSQHDAEKERQAVQKAHEQQLKDQQKEFEKKQKEQEKAFHDQQKGIEKQQAKEQKHHNKLVAAEDEKHQKEVEKEQKQHEKKAERAEKQHQKDLEEEDEGKEKKHHLFSFLHRDKKDKAKNSSGESTLRQSRDSLRHSREIAGAGAAAGVAGGAAAYEAAHYSDSDGRKGRNKLHKDPPKGHPTREAMEQ